MTYQLEYKRDGSGFYEVGLAGETLGARKLVYLDTNGQWRLADQSDAAKMPCLGITLEEISANKYGRILTQGYVGDASWGWNEGYSIYASAIPGELTEVLITSGQQQIVAHAKKSDLIYLFPWDARGSGEEAYYRYEPLNADMFGRPNVNPPAIVEQDNIILYAFTVNTDKMFVKIPVPGDYVSGPIGVTVYWTNDGGVDDEGKTVKAQIDYQITNIGDVVSGSHANSPRSVQDTYTSAAGWVEHRSDAIEIPAAEFDSEDCIFMKLTFITPTGTALTAEPHLIGLCLEYLADPDR